MEAEKLMIVLLQCWYKDVLFQPNVDGYTELIKILKDDLVQLSFVAHEMSMEKKISKQEDKHEEQSSSTETNEEQRKVVNPFTLHSNGNVASGLLFELKNYKRKV